MKTDESQPRGAGSSPRTSTRRWAIVLAAGDGTRLRSLTTSERGVAVPKQFCSLDGGPSLLAHALARAAAVVPRRRILVVVAEEHHRWWRREVARLPVANVIVQPANRGTAAGILLPLLALVDRDPEANLLVVPSDHFVADEPVLAAAARRALERTESRDVMVLLGIEPQTPEPGFGWIVPGARRGRGPRPVAEFVEKPDAAVATELMRRGGVWNSFLFTSRAASLVERYRRRLPALVAALERTAPIGGAPNETLRRAYSELPVLDFSRELLQSSRRALEVLAVSACGWNDLGTPERVADCLGGARQPLLRMREQVRRFAPINLSLAYRRFAASA